MDYEKAYKEALERAKMWQEHLNEVGYKDFADELNYIFSGLRESEDEKIRKMIINHLMQERGSLSNDEAAEAIAWLEKQGEQPQGKTALEAIKEEKVDNQNRLKPADKVEPKFKVGDWVILTTGELSVTLQIVNVDTNKKLYWFNDKSYLPIVDEECLHHWTIQDAKDGDVLAYETDEEDLWIMIYWSLYEPYEGHVHYHALLANDNFSDKGTCCICINDLKPATKEQRDTLMKAMADAGWEFDFEKKELKKIEEEVNGEDYGIDGLWHAQRILEETLGGVEGYQTDDGILEHKAAITAVKKLYEQKPAEWSEEDENRFNNLIFLVEHSDENKATKEGFIKFINKLKSLGPQNTWKPSDAKLRYKMMKAKDFPMTD